MGVQMQEFHHGQASVQIQGTPQEPRWKTIISVKFIRNVLTWHGLVHHQYGDSTFNHQWMEYTPGGLCHGLSFYQHQVLRVHGYSTRYRNQGLNQDDARLQYPQEPLWADTSI